MKVTSILNKEGNQYAEQTDKWWLVKSKMSSVKPIPNLKSPLLFTDKFSWNFLIYCMFVQLFVRKCTENLCNIDWRDTTQNSCEQTSNRSHTFLLTISELSTYTNRKTNIKQWFSITEMTVLVWKYKKKKLSSTIVWFSICINFISFLL